MDPDDNCLNVIEGRKLIRLYGCDVNAMNPNELGTKGRTIQSQIDCDNMHKYDIEVINKIKNVKCQYCLLRNGDTLYFPAFWWHQVSSPEPTISVNAFFGDNGVDNYYSKIINSPQRDSLLYWLCNIVKQNFSSPSFHRLLITFKGSLCNFFLKQWHEVLSEAEIGKIYQYIFDRLSLHSELEKAMQLEDKQPDAKNPTKLKIRGLVMRRIDGNAKRKKH
jgi:hypothetical protein